MTSLTNADIRRMVDDLDATIRDAVAKGDIAGVFKRERGNFVSNRITGGGKTKISKKKTG